MRPEKFEGDGADFRERIIWVIKNLAGKPPRYKYLEDRFGITARKWQNVCNHAQQPSIEMVAALATVYPFFMSWMLTGQSLTFTQVSPADENWFVNLMSKLEGAEKDAALTEYADALLEDVSDMERPFNK